MHNLLLVGCGHMGSALLNSWYKKSSLNISVIDPNKFIELRKKYNNKTSIYRSLKEIKKLQVFDVVVFAIKPQIAKKVVSQFKSLCRKNTLFLSIVAGKKIEFFENNLDHNYQFIRAMPNLPALVSKGMTCLVSNKKTSTKSKKMASDLFNSVGKTIWLKRESDINKVTAISGSGPAYYFLFIEHLILGAIELGLNKNVAEELVYQTALGSINLLLQGNKSANELRKNIAVQGGTTEAAINVFEKNLKLGKITKKAIQAAYNRATKLGDK